MSNSETQLLISGMHCAACVRRVEKALNKVEGVNFASVNLADQTAFVEGYADSQAMIQAVEKIGFGAEMLESEEERRTKQQAQTKAILNHKKWQFTLALIVGFSLMVVGMFIGMMVTERNHLTWFTLAFVSLATMYFSGKDFFIGAWKSLQNRAANMDTLVAVSTGVAWFYSFGLLLFPQVHAHVYFEASVMILGFINLGKFLELKAKQRSSLALEKLLDLAPKQAVIFEEGIAKTIPVKGIKPDMLVQALAGDRLAVDGILTDGIIWVDESMLTGEALPVEKKIGDKVHAGTLIQDGSGIYKAEQVGSQTALARVINAVRHAQSSKPPLAHLVDKIASVFVPVVVTIALVAVLIWLALGKDFAFTLSIFTTVLIIACPCALGLAIPLSTIAGVARAAEMGVLVKNIDALQASSEIDTLVFDKTGTLTTGAFGVQQTLHLSPEELQTVVAMERSSTHPIAKAIVKVYGDGEKINAENMPGLGLRAEIAGETWLAGTLRLLEKQGVSYPEELQTIPDTIVACAKNGRFIGCILLSDTLKPDAADAISMLRKVGITHVEMLSGDKQALVDKVADELQLEQALGDLLPQHKAERIETLQKQ